MISRHWKGLVQRTLANDCVALLQGATLSNLRAMPGFVRATILRRDVADGVEFQIVSLWGSFDDIRAFTAADAEAGVIPRSAQAMMLSFDRQVVHYDVVDSLESPGALADQRQT